MDNLRGIGGITPPSQGPSQASAQPAAGTPAGGSGKYDPSQDAFHNYIIGLMGTQQGEAFWNLYTKSVQEECMKQIRKADARALAAQKEAKNV